MSASARRIRVDVRFFIGVALVIASVFGVWLVITAARTTTAIAVAAEVIVPGQRLTADDLRSVDVTLGASSDRYLMISEFAEGAVAARTVGPGELIPRDAVLIGNDSDTTTVVVDSAVAIASEVDAGSIVDVWLTPPADGDSAEPARILVAGATVVAVRETTSMVKSSGVRVELVVPRSSVGRLLEAQSGTGILAVVPGSG